MAYGFKRPEKPIELSEPEVRDLSIEEQLTNEIESKIEKELDLWARNVYGWKIDVMMSREEFKKFKTESIIYLQSIIPPKKMGVMSFREHAETSYIEKKTEKIKNSMGCTVEEITDEVTDEVTENLENLDV